MFIFQINKAGQNQTCKKVATDKVAKFTINKVAINKATMRIVAISVIGSLLFTGCGQKGNLYMPDDANENVDFILYKNNKPDLQTDTDETGDDLIDDTVEMISDDPIDY